MGLDTHGLLLGHITPDEVYAFILQEIDTNAEMSKSLLFPKNMGKLDELDFNFVKKDDSELWEITSGHITFKSPKGDPRMLFYSYNNINTFENLEYYKKYGLEDMVKANTTFISLGYNDEAVDIIKRIVTHFGGWIDENDCDDKEYYYIEKNTVPDIKPIIRVKMKDVYEKFGGRVIIEDL